MHLTNQGVPYNVGDVVQLDGQDHVLVTNKEEDVKNGYPGGDGITLVGARAVEGNMNEDRWFYDDQVTRVVKKG
jgi:hypothetical protein